jgi:NFU1 iron-sulfur cluster scaffold homolog, mitochondrial
MVLEKFKHFFRNEKIEENINKTTADHEEAMESNITVGTELTPNPNALKFIVNITVKKTGNSTYRSPTECESNPLALALFKVRGVDQIHIFDNVITVSKFNYQEWSDVEQELVTIIKNLIPSHDSDYFDPDPEADRRRNLPNDLKEIELILDKTIRPGLQADGGDIQTITYKENILVIRYQGACGTCPSSTTGTLEAIKGILRDEYNPKIDVYIEPAIY